MDTTGWLWIAVAVLALTVAGIFVWAWRRSRELEQLRAEARELQAEVRDRLHADQIVRRAMGVATPPTDDSDTVKRHRHLYLIKGGLGAAVATAVAALLRWVRQQPVQAVLATTAAAAMTTAVGALAAGWTPPGIRGGGAAIAADASPRHVVTAPADVADSPGGGGEPDSPELETVGDVDLWQPDPDAGKVPSWPPTAGGGAAPAPPPGSDPGPGADPEPEPGPDPQPGPTPGPVPDPDPDPDPDPEPDPTPPDEDEPGCSLLPLLDLVRCLVPIL